MKHPKTKACQRFGRSRSNTVAEPVFAVRLNGDNGQIDIIRSDNSRYDVFSGKLTRTRSLPHQKFYLVIDEITMEDNGKQFVCIDEDDVDYVEDYFFGDHTTIVVHSNEGEKI